MYNYRPAVTPLELDFMVRLWAYEPGHSKLLLRGFSHPEAVERQRIVDVMFHSVSRMKLDSAYHKFSVRLGSASENGPGNNEVGPLAPDDKVYLINPESGSWFVVAERMDWAFLKISGHEESPLITEDASALRRLAVGDVYWL
jgi:hypothetical protein